MRKIFPFEISVATKDRSKTFQFITLVLFSFSVTVIVTGAVRRVFEPAEQRRVVNKPVPPSYADMNSVQAVYSLQK